MRNIGVICGLLIVHYFSACASDDNYQVPYEEIRAASEKYLAANVSRGDLAKMEKRLKDSVETMMDDTGCGREQAMRDLMFNWAADHQGAVKRKEKDAIRQACFYFIKFIDLGYDMPWQIREQLTPENVKEILDYLNGNSVKDEKK